MKSNKTIGILFLILVGILGLIGGKFLWQKRNNDVSDQEYQQRLKGLDKKEIVAIQLQKGDEKLDLATDEQTEQWMVGGVIANAEQVSSLLNVIKKPTGLMIVAETKNKHNDFQITDEEATKLKITSNGNQTDVALVTLLLGANSGGGRYIRFEGDDRVYLVKGLSGEMISTTQDDWIDKVIVKIDQESITKIEISSSKTKVSLEQKESKWYKTGTNEEVGKEPLSPILMTLESLVVKGLRKDGERNNYTTNPTTTVKIEQQSGGTITLEFYSGKEDGLVKSSQSDVWYKISTSTMEKFDIKI